MSASGDRVKDLLEHISDALALQADVVVEEDGRNIRATLEGDDLGLFIGRHGQTIDAVQHLAFKAATRDHPPASGLRVVVDAAGYRERREQALQRQADEAAEKAVDSRRPVALDAMSATERKVVHEYLKDREDVETYSEGTEPDRHLVVAPLDSLKSLNAVSPPPPSGRIAGARRIPAGPARRCRAAAAAHVPPVCERRPPRAATNRDLAGDAPYSRTRPLDRFT